MSEMTSLLLNDFKMTVFTMKITAFLSFCLLLRFYLSIREQFKTPCMMLYSSTRQRFWFGEQAKELDLAASTDIMPVVK